MKCELQCKFYISRKVEGEEGDGELRYSNTISRDTNIDLDRLFSGGGISIDFKIRDNDKYELSDESAFNGFIKAKILDHLKEEDITGFNDTSKIYIYWAKISLFEIEKEEGLK